MATTLKPRKLTDDDGADLAWPKSALEVVSWKSQDGATIEGVLHKPIGFQAGKKYPPSSSSTVADWNLAPERASARPSIRSTSGTRKGAVLEPNYRGSAG